MDDSKDPRLRDRPTVTFSPAADRILTNEWSPPRTGVVPRIRIGHRWYNVLWVLPIGVLLLIGGVAIAQELRSLPGVQEFIARYPGLVPLSQSVHSGYPAWLRMLHLLNIFFMMFIMRSGIQILADHPRLYWKRDCTPGTEWFRFQHEVPQDRMWTSKDDSVTIPKWLGIPGVRHSIGLARWWHFSFDLLWVINGLIFLILLFSTDQCQRLVPTSWSVFPNALSTALQYWSLDFPLEQSWTRYNALQQLTYFATVFVAAPLAVLSGLMQSPAIANRMGLLAKLINRQAARTIHFGVLCWFLLFIVIHVNLVFITGARENLNFMFAGVNDGSWNGPIVFGFVLVAFIAAWVVASPLTIRHARQVQKTGQILVGPLMGFAEWGDPKTQYREQDVSPHFWLNGTMPSSEEYVSLASNEFKNYALRVSGLVENPRTFSSAELKAMPRQEQITEHFCIQGWSGVAKWGGVPMAHVLGIVKPAPEARYVVFYSFAEGAAGGTYYDVHRIHNMRHALTLLAYEMNGTTLSLHHGAPLRLRCENELGFKMVKWISAIEFVSDFADLGGGQGGYNEDHEFYGYRMPI